MGLRERKRHEYTPTYKNLGISVRKLTEMVRCVGNCKSNFSVQIQNYRNKQVLWRSYTSRISLSSTSTHTKWFWLFLSSRFKYILYILVHKSRHESYLIRRLSIFQHINFPKWIETQHLKILWLQQWIITTTT